MLQVLPMSQTWRSRVLEIPMMRNPALHVGARLCHAAGYKFSSYAML